MCILEKIFKIYVQKFKSKLSNSREQLHLEKQNRNSNQNFQLLRSKFKDILKDIIDLYVIFQVTLKPDYEYYFII